MIADICKTIQLPFERGLLAYPEKNSRILFLNALALDCREFDWRPNLQCVQERRDLFLSLSASGFTADHSLDKTGFGSAMVLADKHKRRNELNFARAWNAVPPGGQIVVAGYKTDGIASLRKYVSRFTDIKDSLAKHHGTVFWITRGADDIEVEAGSLIPAAGYQTGPGMFSSDKVDKASALLASNFDNRIGGNVADFGAGWGYLSGELLNRQNSVRHLDLYENDWSSLEAAKLNLAERAVEMRSEYFWFDLLSEPISRKYNWIIMNPPFHSDRKGDPDIGKNFIEVAHAALAGNGRLLMVANRHLPYEATLKRLFKKVEKIADEAGFKVFEAIK